MDYFNFQPDHEKIRLVSNSPAGPFDIWYGNEWCGQVDKFDFAEIVQTVTISARKRWIAALLEPPPMIDPAPVSLQEPEPIEEFGKGIYNDKVSC